jgi:polyisoprenoid-binding protein YceI
MSLLVERSRQLWSRALISALTVLTLAAVSPADAQEWQVNKARSSVSLQLVIGGETVEAQFAGYKFDIRFDPDEPSEGEITGTMDATSLSTGNPERDALLYSPEWLNGATFPVLKIAAASMKERDPGSYLMQADVTAKGVTKRLAVPLIVEDEGNSGKIHAEIRASRRAFGIGQASEGPDELAIVIDLSATHLTN